MNTFLQEIHNLKPEVKRREAEQQAAKEKAEQEKAELIRNVQLSATKESARLLGITITDDMIKGQNLNEFAVDDWLIRIALKQYAIDGAGRIWTAGVNPTAKQYDNLLNFKADFVYVPTIYKRMEQAFPEINALYIESRKIDVTGLSNPFSVSNSFHGFDMTFTFKNEAIVQPIQGETKLNLAEKMLAIESGYQTHIATFGEWKEKAEKAIQDRKAEIEEEEKRQREWEADQARREEQQATKQYPYNFSGDSLGDVLEQVLRQIAREESEVVW